MDMLDLLSEVLERDYSGRYKYIDENGNVVWNDGDKGVTKATLTKKVNALKKEKAKQVISEIENELIGSVLKEYDYDGRGDVALYCQDINSDYYIESKSIQLWIQDMDNKMYELQDNIDNFGVDIDDYDEFVNIIIAEFPTFNYDEYSARINNSNNDEQANVERETNDE